MPPELSTTPPLMQMEDLAFGSMWDPERLVAEHVNWTVYPGDFWVVAGLQGSGKSQLLMAGAGLLPPKGGRYLFKGEPMPILDDSRLYIRLRLGLVFESGQLIQHLTFRENIALPLRYHRNLSASQSREEVEQILTAFELGPWADTSPGAANRTWHKRASLARALALKPELLLVDNPLSGLDLPQAQWWIRFLNELSRGHAITDGQPVTIVVAAADLRPWRGLARQCAILQQKSLVVVEHWPKAPDAALEGLPLELIGGSV